MRILIGAIAGILLFCMLCYPADAATKLLPTEADTYAEQGFPSAAPWNNRNVYIGYDRYYNKRRTRAFLKVDVEDLLEDEILADDISSVRLRMFMYEYEGGGTYYVDVYNIRDTWSEYSLTWNTQPAIAEQISHNPVTENYGWKIFDLTNWAKQTLSGTKTNRGFSLRASNETDRAGIYWSIACQSAPPPSGMYPRSATLCRSHLHSKSAPVKTATYRTRKRSSDRRDTDQFFLLRVD